MLDIYKTLILGIVQGITEFLPISSTGHLIISGNILNFGGEFAKTFDIAIQLGSILAVAIIYRPKFREYIKIKPNLEVFPNVVHIIITMMPAIIIGALFHGAIKEYLFNPRSVAISLIVGSIIMLIADRYQYKKRTDVNVNYKGSLIIGLFQCLSLWPGMSRSGITISGGIFSGMGYRKASMYSFICAVPIMVAACAYELLKTNAILSSHEITMLIVGFIVSFFVGWVAIISLLKLIPRTKLWPFSIYRIVLATIILIYG